MLAALPFFHIFGFTVCMMWAQKIGAALVLAPNPRDIPALIKSITKHRVTLFPAVPAMFNAINEHPGIEKMDISSIQSCFSGSAPLPIAVLQRFEELTGCRIVEGFGLTEILAGDPRQSPARRAQDRHHRHPDARHGLSIVDCRNRAAPRWPRRGRRADHQGPAGHARATGTVRTRPTRCCATAGCTPATSRPWTRTATA